NCDRASLPQLFDKWLNLAFAASKSSMEIFNHVKGLLEIKVDNINTNRLWMSIFKLCKGKSVVSAVFNTMICATVNFIWKERNTRRFQGKSQTALNLKHRLVKEMRNYLKLQLKEIPDILALRRLVSRLGIVAWVRRVDYIACTWSKPSHDMKLNCDGAVNDVGNGYGGL
ncbi:hypothetical protein FRX31_016006, partial [Thalictrum thalictroides]